MYINYLITSPVNGFVTLQIVESKNPVIKNDGMLALSFAFCKDSGLIENFTGFLTALGESYKKQILHN